MNKLIGHSLCALSVVWCMTMQAATQNVDDLTAQVEIAEAPIPASASQYDIEEWTAWLIEAAKVAKDYVLMIDQGKYAESWTHGAKIFQQTITQKEWKTALELARKPLGNVKSRTLKDERPALDPKGLPKGPYMVIEYNTSFERAPKSGELLTLMRESNGAWKVLTYQVN